MSLSKQGDEEVIVEPTESKQAKEPKKNRKEKEGKKKKGRHEAGTIPSDTTVSGLAKAIWTEVKLRPAGSEGKSSSEKRTQLWKSDKKEYVKIARKVISRLGRKATKGEGGGKKGEKKGEKRGKKAEAANTEE
jgi:hypothetical protein